MEYFANNHDAVWYILGGIMLIVEAKVLGLSIGILLFTGIGAMLTGVAVSLGFIHETQLEIITFGITSVVVAGLLWKPFKALQKNDGNTQDTSSDMLGMIVELTSTVSRTKHGTISWSGIEWKAVLDKSCPEDSIEKGGNVKVTAVTAGKMTVTVAE